MGVGWVGGCPIALPPPPSWGWDICGAVGLPQICGGWVPQITPRPPPPPPKEANPMRPRLWRFPASPSRAGAPGLEERRGAPARDPSEAAGVRSDDRFEEEIVGSHPQRPPSGTARVTAVDPLPPPNHRRPFPFNVAPGLTVICPVPRSLGPPCPHPQTHPFVPPPPPPLKWLGKFSSGSSANQNFSLAPSAQVSLGQNISSAPSPPLTTQGLLRGGGGGSPPTAPTHPLLRKTLSSRQQRAGVAPLTERSRRGSVCRACVTPPPPRPASAVRRRAGPRGPRPRD